MSNGGLPGRRSKGPRRQRTVRGPVQVVDAGIEKARRLGLDFNDYVTLLMAKDLGMDDFVPAVRPPSDQPALPIDERGSVRLAHSA